MGVLSLQMRLMSLGVRLMSLGGAFDGSGSSSIFTTKESSPLHPGHLSIYVLHCRTKIQARCTIRNY